jgi:short-subunit dehydrogenase
MSSISFKRKVVLISGASSGLGAAIARVLAGSGHQIALVARRSEKLAKVAAEVRARGGECFPRTADLADLDCLGQVVDDVVDQFGNIDALINNAGIGLPRYYSECDPQALRRQIAVNITAPIVLTRHALPHLITSRGSIINIGSAITALANPILGAYGATKVGLAYWNDATRRELRSKGVSVSLVDLGPVSTDFFDAVHRAKGTADRLLGIDPAPDSLYNAMRDRPPQALIIHVDSAARAIANLLDHPRRRLAVPRRVVWPFRLFAATLEHLPGLTDVSVSAMIRRVEREEATGRESSNRSA